MTRKTEACSYIHWTQEEIDLCVHLKYELKLTYERISKYLKRTIRSIKHALRKYRLQHGQNTKMLTEKYTCNQKFIDIIKPISILDLFAGQKSFYTDKCKYLVSNDINTKYNNTYSIDSEVLLKYLLKKNSIL